MTQINLRPLEPATEQRFWQSGVSWQSFKFIQQGFANSPGVRLFYYQGELEILSTSPAHEIVKGNLGFLLEDYLLTQGIDFVGTGSFSQEKLEEAAAQADESYCFGTVAKPVADLAIEVVFTSGGADKLRRYQALGVQEVWFWQAGSITIYSLKEGDYQQNSCSQFLPDLDLQHLAQCAGLTSRSEAVRAFRTR